MELWGRGHPNRAKVKVARFTVVSSREVASWCVGVLRLVGGDVERKNLPVIIFTIYRSTVTNPNTHTLLSMSSLM